MINIRCFFVCIVGVLFFACNNDESTNIEQSKISVKLMDMPGEYDHVYIDVVDVMVKINDSSENENGWQSLEAINTGVYDLLQLTGGVNLLLVDDFEVLAGRLNQIRLVLGEDNTVVIDGETYPLRTPSAQQSGLKIHVNETLEPNFSYTFVLDFNVDESIIQAGNSDNIILKPVIRASTEVSSGIISGSVLPENIQTLVSATNGTDTITAYTNEEGYFVLVGLDPGNYTVSVTPDPLSGFSEVVINNVEVVVGNTTNIGSVELQ